MSESVRPADLDGLVRRGIAWSAASNLVLRLGSLAVGIILARLLTPEQFGVYAVALTVQAIMITFADLGLSAGLVVSDDPDREAPTVAALGLTAGVAGCAGMVAVAQPLADALGSPDSSQAIQVLAVTLLLAGAGVVPYALLQRRFAQRALFAISVLDFTVSTAITLALVAAGWGVVAIALGRVAAQSCALVLQYVLAAVRPRFAVDRAVVPQVLRFGLPVAATTLLSWAVLNVDNIVVVKVSGAVELGFYVLAFNIAMWPMSALGQVIRSVALPAFARSRDSDGDDSVARAFSLVWALALPAGACLAVIATPVVEVLYGDVWRPAAAVLMALGVFGSFRVLFDLLASFLLAHGRSGLVLGIQVCWCLALVPALVWATREWGAVGAGWAHVAVGLLVVTPLYGVALRLEGVALGRLLGAMARPTLACAPACLAGAWVVGAVDGNVLALVLGFLAGAAVYGLLVGQWIWRLATAKQVESEAGAPPPVALGAEV